MINHRFTRIQTDLPGPKSAAVLEKKGQFVAAPLKTYAPFVIEKSEGRIVEDCDPNRLIGFTGMRKAFLPSAA